MNREEMQEEKARLRQALRAQMKKLSKEERHSSDEAMFARFLSLPELDAAKTVLVFCGIQEEPETCRLIAELFARGLKVCLPRCLPERQMEARRIGKDSVLVPGPWFIPEPSEDCPVASKAELDLILVPALCCDRQGVRLGQGGGYYDRYLQDYDGVTVSLCRKAFLQRKLPWDVYDQRIQIVLTEEERLVLIEA